MRQVLPARAAAASESARPRSRGPRAGEYTVRGGDSLWRIARSLLGSEASDARVGALARALWQENRDRIGTGNPDVLPAGITINLVKETA